MSGYAISNSTCTPCPISFTSSPGNNATSCTVPCGNGETTCVLSSTGVDMATSWYVLSHFYRDKAGTHTIILLFGSNTGFILTGNTCLLTTKCITGEDSCTILKNGTDIASTWLVYLRLQQF